MIHSITNQLFEKYASDWMKIIELGDQLMDIGEKTQFQRSDVFYAKTRGMVIKSIDIHGKNRALAIDLSKEAQIRFDADLLTDFGTCEHVSDLYNALLNCHNWTKEGGLMIHANPKTGTFAGHGVSFFTMDFWRKLSEISGYEILELFEASPYSPENPDKEVIAVLVKGEKPFPDKESFEEIAKETVFKA
jgi:hypothetical protein